VFSQRVRQFTFHQLRTLWQEIHPPYIKYLYTFNMHIRKVLILIACVSMMSMLLVHFSGRIGIDVEKALREGVDSERYGELDITLEEDWTSEQLDKALVTATEDDEFLRTLEFVRMNMSSLRHKK